MSPFVKALFIDKEGIVDITSSKVGQVSFALSNGSLFTNAWVLVAQEMNAKMKKNKKKSLMWNEVVEKLTQKSDQLFKKHFPNGAPGGQQSQIPHAYNYPDIPPRFGVAVMTLSFGNVQITEIMPGLPGDKAGLKVGDVITHIDETEILDEPDYVKAINYAPPVINVTYLRNKKETKTRVELNGEPMPKPTEEEDESAPEPVTETPQESAPAPEPETPQEPAPAPEPETPQEPAPAPEPATPQEPASQPLPPYVPGVPMFGASMNSDQNIFIAIAPNSPASKAGLEVGDRLIQFNDKPIYTGKDFDAAVDASPRRAKLLIMKQEQNNTTPVTIILNKEEIPLPRLNIRLRLLRLRLPRLRLLRLRLPRLRLLRLRLPRLRLQIVRSSVPQWKRTVTESSRLPRIHLPLISVLRLTIESSNSTEWTLKPGRTFQKR